MLRILDKNKVPVKGLRKYSDLCIENSIELDDKTLTFSVPYRNVRSAIVVEGYIETKEDRFVVKEIEKSSEGTANITAQLDLESLEGKPFRTFRSEEQTIKAALQLAFTGTGWTVGECSVSKKRTLSMANVSALDVLKQALKTYRAEIKIDSKKQSIDIYPEIGSDKGVYFSDQLNLRKLTVQYSTYDFYTEIEPYGKDGLTIETVNSGKIYLENHQYSSKKKRCIWKDERYTIADSLKEDAAAKLADMSKPYVSYSADIVDLSRNSQKYSILQYEIGDTVTLIDHVTGEKEKQRIVSVKIYPEAPEKNSCTLANKVLTFDELAQKYEDTADTVDNITNDNGQIDGDAIDGIHSRQIIDLENGIIESAYIKELGVKYLDVSGKITAVEGEFGILKSNTAQFEETYTKRLEAVEGDIYTLRTTDFTAVNAKIGILDNEFGNIKVLLSGGAGIGEIQNIHLTSQNAVIDSALIRSAVMQTVSVADLLAGTISTNKFLIASDDGGIRIQGATQQWSDTDGTVRMQAGRDANGDFTFSLFDKTGKGILIDATGVKPDAIADGLIVNKMVSDSANIAASKLDINSLFTEINNSSKVIKSMDTIKNYSITALSDAKKYTDECDKLVIKDSQDYSKSYTLSEIGKLEASGGNLVKGYRFSDDNIKAYWNTAGTIKSGQNDPDGGKNAVAIVADAANCYLASKRNENTIINATGRYTVTFWAKASKAQTVTFSFNKVSESIALTTTWKKFSFIKDITSIATSGSLIIFGGSNSISTGDGTIYIYRPDVRHGYSSEDIFNLLTNNGNIQGMYMTDGKLYWNGTYIKSKSITTAALAADSVTAEKIKVDDLYSLKASIAGFKISSDTISHQSITNPESGIGQNYYDTFFSSKDKRLTFRKGPGTSDYITFDIRGLRASGGKRLNLISDAETNDSSEGFSSGAHHSMGHTNIYGNLYVADSFRTAGTKQAVRQTENYGEKGVYCYETPTPHFGDIGSGEISEDGKCCIDIEDILKEMINTEMQYYVFLQKCGEGDLYVSECFPDYFIVTGTPGLRFFWELKAKQKGYEYNRYEGEDRVVGFRKIAYDEEYIAETEKLIEEREEI